MLPATTVERLAAAILLAKTVVVVFPLTLEFSREKLDFAHDLSALFPCSRHNRSRLGKFRRQTGAEHQKMYAIG